MTTSRIGPPPSKSKSGWKILAALFVVGALAVGVAVVAFPPYVRGEVTFTLEKVSLPERKADPGGVISGAVSGFVGDVTAAARAITGTGDVIARVRVKNGMPLSGAVTAAHYVMVINDKEVGHGDWNAGASSVALPSGGEAVLELPFQLDTKNLAAGALDALTGQPMAVKLNGEATVTAMGASVNAPFSLSPAEVKASPGK